MEMIKKSLKKVSFLSAIAISVGVFLSSSAYAALDLTLVTFPLADVEAVASLILAASAGLWVIYKVLTLIRRG